MFKKEENESPIRGLCLIAEENQEVKYGIYLKHVSCSYKF